MIVELQGSDRWQAIDELINSLVACKKISQATCDLIAAAVKKRETSMTTGIGFGIGIPHASTNLVSDVVYAIGRSQKGVNFSSIDGKLVHLVCLFLVPAGQFQKHLHALANIAKLLHKADFRSALNLVSNEAELKRLLEPIMKEDPKISMPVLPHKKIELALQAAVRAVLPDADVSAVLVRPCDPKFGDYQSNALMSLAKQRKLNPRQLATDTLAKLDVSDVCEKVEIAGAGFLNFRLKNSVLTQTLEAAARGEHLFFTKAAAPKTVVIDFSSPNVAKPMHVGHIRSTGIGDALQRTLRLLGHRVISDNHIGDWGTQFGLIILGIKRSRKFSGTNNFIIPEDFEDLYKNMVQVSKNNPEILEKARLELVKLQSGDEENRAIWEMLVQVSKDNFDGIYSLLGVKFDFTLGESFYNPWLGEVVNDLLAKNIAHESEGAVGVFSDGSLPPKEDPFLVNRDGEWIPDPALVRKSDGGFNYTTTDLATVDYRIKTWSPQEIVYVVDDRQSAHFKKLFMTFVRWQSDAAKKVKLVHVGFGKIMGDDGKPFKTRSGDTVKLIDLLLEAELRAFEIVSDKSPELPEAQRREIARVVGLGAVKYADLLPNRQSDYIFNWDKMLALQGNTSTYLQFAYMRIKGIFRKAEAESAIRNSQSAIILAAPQEITLANHLLNFGLTLEAVAEEYRPNFLCNYLFELAGKFTGFYENCPVLKADEAATRDSRLALCDLTARVLKQGLETLGIETVEQM